MTSLVSEFLINPVLAQARRFSLRAGNGTSTITSQESNNINSGRNIDSTTAELEEKDDMADEAPSHIERLMRDASLEDVNTGPGRTASGQDGDTRMAGDGFTDRPLVASPPPLDAPTNTEPLSITTGATSSQPGASGSASRATGGAVPTRLLTNRSLNTNNDVEMSSNPASPFPISDSPALMSPVDTRSGSPAPVLAASAPATQTMSALPEDDGMRTLRAKIMKIQKADIEPAEKARRMHELLTEGWSQRQIKEQEQLRSAIGSLPDDGMDTGNYTSQERPATPTNKGIMGGVSSSFSLGGIWGAMQSPSKEIREPATFRLTAEDLAPTFVPVPDDGMILEWEEENRPLGCQHYKRNVKLQCSECNKWYTCRLCHDAAESHILPRKETKNMLCMLCGTAQSAGDNCKGCGVRAANYYCNVCKLWEDDVNKPIYHCDDCGICRKGAGLGKDYFHCKECGLCMDMTMFGAHKHIERSTDCSCPICFQHLFSSPQTVVFMRCGHTIHRHCYQEHMQTSYKCPICQQSVVNMETQFRRLDRAIEAQPMPEEWRMRVQVMCNDCRAKSVCDYHWLGNICGVCKSYNTRQLQIQRPDAPEGRSAEAEVAVAAVAAANESAVEAGTAEIPIQAPRRRHSSHAHGQFLNPNDRPGFPSYVDSRLGRSASPQRGSYFLEHNIRNPRVAEAQRQQEPRPTPRTQAEQEQLRGQRYADNSLLDLWGTPLDAAHANAEAENEERDDEEEESESESDTDEDMDDAEDDDDDDFDPFPLPGHR